MAVDQGAVAADQHRGGQTAAAQCPGQVAVRVRHHVVQAQTLFQQIAADNLRRLALVGVHETHPRIVALALFQHRHLAPAGRAPAGPQIDQGEAVAGQRGQGHRGAVQPVQGHIRRRLGGGAHGQGHAGGEHRRHRAGQQGAPAFGQRQRVFPSFLATQRPGQGQAGAGHGTGPPEAAVPQVDHFQRTGEPVVVAHHEGHPRADQRQQPDAP